ncbi:MAG: hypothetical protein ACLS7Z_07410 [Christensenellales bacterium]
MKKQKWIVGLMAALSVMLAAVGSLCGAIERKRLIRRSTGKNPARRSRRRTACATTTL